MQIWNGSDEYCWRYSADTILSTDGQTDKVIPVYPPFNFVEAGGIIMNSLWPETCKSNFISVFIKIILQSDIFRVLPAKLVCEDWVPQNPFDDKSTMVQVMAWCLQATSHCLSPCWAISMSSCDVNRPQWFNKTFNWFCNSPFSVHALWSQRGICNHWVLLQLKRNKQNMQPFSNFKRQEIRLARYFYKILLQIQWRPFIARFIIANIS